MATVKLVKSIYTGSDVTSLGELASGDSVADTTFDNLNVSGDLSVTGSGTFAAEVDFGGPINVSGATDLNSTLYVQETAELVNIQTNIAASGSINIDFLNGGVIYLGTATSNFSLNIRGNATTTLSSVLATGEAAGVTILVPQGGTSGYAQTNVLIDGITGVPLWQGGSGTFATSGIDAIGLEIIKTGSGTYTILESVTKFKN